MQPEERELLQRTYALVEENNKILRKMRRSALVTSVFQIFYWVVIIGLSFGAFYFIQPYINNIVGAYNAGVETLTGEPGKKESLTDVGNLTNFFNTVKELESGN